MKLYLDDDSVDPILIRLLKKAGHDVLRPADIRSTGTPDPVHLRHAIRQGRVLLTGNHDDFKYLHELIVEAQGHHPGVLIVRRDNNPKRDLTPPGVVRAIARMLAAHTVLGDQLHILNHWR